MSLLLAPPTVDGLTEKYRHARARAAFTFQRAAVRLADRIPSRVRPLAEPPPGSGLKPVLGDFGPPVIGYTFHSIVDPLGFGQDRYDRFGDVQWVGVLGRKVVFVGSPAAFEAVLLDRNKVMSAERGWEYLIGPFFRGGLMLRDFEDHLHHRRIMQQAFTRPRLEGYLALTTPLLERSVAAWEPGPQFPVYPAIKKMLLQQATAVFAGAELGPIANRLEHAFEDAVHGGMAIIRANVPGGVWARGLRGRRTLSEYFRSELPAKRAGDGADLFSVLTRARSTDGHAFTDQEVVEHMIFVMMAAHDTSTIASSMLIYELGRHPEWQERVRAESLALGKDSLDYADLEKLPSLDLAFRETLRMWAPVGQQARETTEDTELCGHFVPKGTLVMTGPFGLMRNAEFWHDPDTFDPERFVDGRREDKSHRFAWPPFGGGAHKCIGLYFGGMTVKAVLHRMLLSYRWSVPAGYVPPMVPTTGPTPADGLPIRLERLP
ncbi:cytochrome P450 [Nocardia sp. NPDC057353]|uniref:cytochrome P450 n=1 Tax=Nocardia sp. NPDC057353 TaxID=3346104 RepID=UPI003628E476